MFPPFESGDPPLYHWYDNAVPVTFTLNDAALPLQIVCETTGWLLIIGV
jgi:hypothetical protein